MTTSRFGLLWLLDHPAIGSRIVNLGTQFVVVFLLVVWAGWLLILAGAISVGEYVKVDFFSFYSSSSLALHGHASAAYDAVRLHAEEVKLPGDDSGLQPWRNPPIFFLFVWPLALLPLSAALAAWIGATAALLFSAVNRMRSERTLLMISVAFPATFWNLIIGQNGFLTAGLFAWGMLLLQKRPFLAGAILGLLTFKPQFFPLVIVGLYAGNERRALAGAAVSACSAALVTLVLFGPDSWIGFVNEALRSGDSIYSGGQSLAKMQSVSALLLLAGVSVAATQAVQALVSLCMAVFVFWLWRKSDVPFAYKAAGLGIAVVLASPYSYHYDLEVLGIACLWMGIQASNEGWRAGDLELLMLVWLLPLTSLIAGLLIGVVIGPLVMLLLAARLIGLTESRRVRGVFDEAQPSLIAR